MHRKCILLSETECHIINNLLTELARAVLGNIGPRSWQYGPREARSVLLDRAAITKQNEERGQPKRWKCLHILCRHKTWLSKKSDEWGFIKEKRYCYAEFFYCSGERPFYYFLRWNRLTIPGRFLVIKLYHSSLPSYLVRLRLSFPRQTEPQEKHWIYIFVANWSCKIYK